MARNFFVAAGVYLVNYSKSHGRNLLAPLKELKKNKGALAMLGVAFIWSLGAHFSKMKVVGSSPIFSTFISGLTGVITTYILALIKKQSINYSIIKKHFSSLGPLGFFYVLANFSSSTALKSGPATYVFTIKRSSLVFGSLVGKFYFKEVVGIVKLFGLLLIMLGIFLIAI